MSYRRQEIVDAITLLLQGMTEIGGYTVEFGSKVFPWKQDKVKSSEAPCICLWDLDGRTSFEDTVIGTRRHDLRIEVVAFLKPPFVAVTARKVLSDLVAKIGRDPLLSGKLTLPIQIVSTELDNITYADVVAAGKLTLLVTYFSGKWEV